MKPYKKLSLIGSITIIFLIIPSLILLTKALTPEEVLDILNLKEVGPVAPTSSSTEPTPPKESQAVVLGQLLRKFLQDNFRQLYYELYVINATLSGLRVSNITKNVGIIAEVIPQINVIRENLELIKGTINPISEIQDNLANVSKAMADVHLLTNLSFDMNQFKQAYFSDTKKQAASLIKLVQLGYTTAIRVTDIHQKFARKRSCHDLLQLGESNSSGIYSIMPQTLETQGIDWKSKLNESMTKVYCDMGTDGGGWTVIQQRGVGNLLAEQRPNFNRNWIEYENGFGNASGDYWLGLENIRSLTRNCPHELLINLTDWEGESRFAHYEKFHIGSKLDSYRLFVEGHSGNVDDSLLYHNKKQFSTFDEDNDNKWGEEEGRSSCAKMYGGGWWFGDCLKSNLNGIYPEDGSKGRVEKLSGLRWNSWTPLKYSLKMTEMKIRPISNC